MSTAAGIILAILTGVLLVNLAQGGPGQVTQWLRAKFLGDLRP